MSYENMRCPTPCEECRTIVELHTMRKLRGGLGGFVCVDCWQKEMEAEEIEEDDYE